MSSIHSEFPEGRDFICLSATGAQVSSGKRSVFPKGLSGDLGGSSGDLEV